MCLFSVYFIFNNIQILYLYPPYHRIIPPSHPLFTILSCRPLIPSHSPALYHLIISSQHLMGSKHLMDRDLEPLHSSPLRHTLTNIDFTGCVKLTDRGVGVLASALGRGLASLSVAKTKVTDHGELLSTLILVHPIDTSC